MLASYFLDRSNIMVSRVIVKESFNERISKRCNSANLTEKDHSLRAKLSI